MHIDSQVLKYFFEFLALVVATLGTMFLIGMVIYFSAYLVKMRKAQFESPVKGFKYLASALGISLLGWLPFLAITFLVKIIHGYTILMRLFASVTALEAMLFMAYIMIVLRWASPPRFLVRSLKTL